MYNTQREERDFEYRGFVCKLMRGELTPKNLFKAFFVIFFNTYSHKGHIYNDLINESNGFKRISNIMEGNEELEKMKICENNLKIMAMLFTEELISKNGRVSEKTFDALIEARIEYIKRK